MLSISYISRENLDKTRTFVSSFIKAINKASIPTRCIIVCAAPLDVCEFILDSKIMARCSVMKRMIYIQASPGEATQELIDGALAVGAKDKFHKYISHEIIIDKSTELKENAIDKLIPTFKKHMKQDDPIKYYMYPQKSYGCPVKGY